MLLSLRAIDLQFEQRREEKNAGDSCHDFLVFNLIANLLLSLQKNLSYEIQKCAISLILFIDRQNGIRTLNRIIFNHKSIMRRISC